MTKATRPDQGALSAPAGRPPRADILHPMLKGTRRAFVPIRRAFIQKPQGTTGSRGASLAQLSRSGSALDAYLLIHALASSSEPYVAKWPVGSWVQAARLDESAPFKSAKSRWSKVVSKLVEMQLVERSRQGNDMLYRLLHESGDGSEYTRPTTTKHGNWFRLPYAYWFDGFDVALTHPEKLILLIALDQPKEFILPFNQSAKWYGIAESTAQRGMRGLVDRGLAKSFSSWVPSPRSPIGWSEQFTYALQAPFSRASIDEAQAASRGGAVEFSAPEGDS